MFCCFQCGKDVDPSDPKGYTAISTTSTLDALSGKSSGRVFHKACAPSTDALVIKTEDAPQGDEPHYLSVNMHEIGQLIAENERMRDRICDLLTDNTRLVNERRAVDIDGNVAEFMAAFDQHREPRPAVPPDDVARLRLRIVVEEFFELMRASMGGSFAPSAMVEASAIVNRAVDIGVIKVDMIELADACADLDYVVAGLRLAFGINGRPIAALVHAANMAKVGGPIRESDGKRLKPPGWQPPDIEGELRRQGWQP